MFGEYFGIVGFKEAAQARTVLASAPKTPGRKIGIVVIATPEVLRGAQTAGRCVAAEKIQEIFQDHSRAFNVLEVFDESKNHTLTYDDAMLAREIAGSHCHALQFNMPWPNPQAIAHIAFDSRRIGLILHVGKRAMGAVNHDPKVCAKKIMDDYGPLIDYVIFDQSDGLGIPFDPQLTFRFLDELWYLNSRIGLVVGGGICSGEIKRLKPLAEVFDISTSAQTGVHDERGAFSTKQAIALLKEQAKFFKAAQARPPG